MMKNTILFLLQVCLLFCPIKLAAQSLQDESFKQIESKAESGNVEAQFCLGLMYGRGLEGCKKDFGKAVFWLKQSIENGYKRATPYLAMAYYNENKFSDAYPLFFSFAQNPENKEVDEYMYAHSLYFVGTCKLKGEGITKNERGAIYWLEKAKINGVTGASALLGVCHLHGLGVKKDPKKAYLLFKEAFDKDKENELYALDLVECYILGYGNAQDIKTAYPLVEKYVEGTNVSHHEKNKATAQLVLGIAYYKDDTEPMHYNKAFYWLKKVEENDHATEKEKASAIYWLQRCYRFGRGVTKDVNKANELIEQYSGYESDEPNLIELLELKK